MFVIVKCPVILCAERLRCTEQSGVVNMSDVLLVLQTQTKIEGKGVGWCLQLFDSQSLGTCLALYLAPGYSFQLLTPYSSKEEEKLWIQFSCSSSRRKKGEGVLFLMNWVPSSTAHWGHRPEQGHSKGTTRGGFFTLEHLRLDRTNWHQLILISIFRRHWKDVTALAWGFCKSPRIKLSHNMKNMVMDPLSGGRYLDVFSSPFMDTSAQPSLVQSWQLTQFIYLFLSGPINKKASWISLALSLAKPL